jgi:hypothetical protein
MAYVPPNAQWYVAELVEQITVAGDPRSVVHRNLVLIRADSPEDAYEKALLVGSDGEDAFENPAGKKVRIVFRGLSELSVVHDELDHGAELLYDERIGAPDEEIKRWLRPKEQLSVFRSIDRDKSPDYSSGEILQEARHLSKRSTNSGLRRR